MAQGNIAIPPQHVSYWLDTLPPVPYPKLEKNVTTDIAIIGGGIAGLTAAYRLAGSGKKVTLLEAGSIAAGVSGHTTAKLTSLHTIIYSRLIEKYSREKAGLYASAQQNAVDFVSSTVKLHAIDCDLVTAPALTYAWKDIDREAIIREVEAAKSLGLPASLTDDPGLPFPTAGAIRFDDQHYFHPRKYLTALANLAALAGVSIYEQSRVMDVEEKDRFLVKLDRYRVKAKQVLVTSHYPFLNRGAFYARLHVMRSYVLGVYLKQKLPDAMYISSTNPVYSIRPQRTVRGTMYIITGEEHYTGRDENTQRYYDQLLEQTRSKLAVASVEYAWSTQDAYTTDNVPYIGRYEPKQNDLWVGSGFGGWGMSNGTAAGLLLSDLALGVKNPFTELFDPYRTQQMRAFRTLVKENVGVVKELVGGKAKLHPGIKNIRISKGQGKVIRTRSGKSAVYEDQQGTVHAVSSTCTHLGCDVKFNNAEISWDCPCHGSRFSVDGDVLHGPAVRHLKKTEL